MEWIPVSERLPETCVRVLVTIYGTDLVFVHDGETLEDALERASSYCRVTIGNFDEDGCWNESDGYPMIIAPTAWMPLPEPYRAEGREE